MADIDKSLLLEDTQPFAYKIEEGKTNKGLMKLSGICQLGEVVNDNKRQYPNALFERLLAEGSPFQQKIAGRRVLGELGHPKDRANTSLTETSHLMTKLWLDHGQRRDCVACEKSMNPGHLHVMCEEEVLGTPKGQILNNLYENNIGVGISSRGSGTLENAGEYKRVSDNYKLITWDHVLEQSTPGAIPRVVSESVVDVVGRFASSDVSSAELQGYGSILSEVLASDLPDELRANAQGILDAITVRIANQDVTSVQVPSFSTPTTFSANAPLQPITIKVESSVPAATGGSITNMQDSEDRMGTITKDQPEVQQIVADALRDQASQLRQGFEDVVNDQNTTIKGLQTEATELEARNLAAKEVGTELVSQLKEAQIKLEAYKSHNEGTDDDLQERFDTAKQVIEELVNRVRGNKYAEARADAAEKLLAEVVARSQREKLMGHIDTLIQSVPEAAQESVKGFLAEAQSISDANRRFSMLSGLMQETALGEQTNEPEPTQEPARQVVTEGTLPQPQTVQESLAPATPQTESTPQPISESLMLSRALTKRLNPTLSH